MHYFTRADVFSNPVARWFVLRMNMLPIYRPKDRVPDAERNQQTSAVISVLDAGAASLAWNSGSRPPTRAQDAPLQTRLRRGRPRRPVRLLPFNRGASSSSHWPLISHATTRGTSSPLRLRVGAPIDLMDLGANPEDNGPNRILQE